MYDRFGRLIHGSETVPKDTIDFIVFEKHVSDTEGRWRLHAKLKPDWLSNSQSAILAKTMVIKSQEEKETDSQLTEVATTK